MPDTVRTLSLAVLLPASYLDNLRNLLLMLSELNVMKCVSQDEKRKQGPLTATAKVTQRMSRRQPPRSHSSKEVRSALNLILIKQCLKSMPQDSLTGFKRRE